MKQTPNSRRLNEQAREVVSSILIGEISDPRLGLVTVTGAEVSPDRSERAQGFGSAVSESAAESGGDGEAGGTEEDTIPFEEV